MNDSVDVVTLWHVAPGCVGSAELADADEAGDEELLEAVWAAAHSESAVEEWPDLRVRADAAPPPSVLYVEEPEVLVYSDAVRGAVEAARGADSDHTWLPVTVEVDGSEVRYWVLSCGVPDVKGPNGTVDGARVRGASVVHYAVGDNFPAFVDHARRAIESACADVTFTRANP